MSVFRYPLRKLDNAEDYIQIDVLEYEPPGLGTKGGSTFALRSSDDTLLNKGDSIQNILQSVILPIPEGIGDSMAVGWGEGRINPIQAGLLGAASNIITSKEPFRELEKQIELAGGTIGKVVQSATGQSAVTAALSSAVVNTLAGGGDVNQAISRATGSVFNPNIELLFSGVNLRGGFTFSFDLIPRFQKEGDEVRRIIRLFKQSMAPKRQAATGELGGIFIKSPNVYRLRYMNGGRIHPYLNRFKICALTNMDVSYTGSGTYATYSDGTPVHMRLTLAFQELTPIYAEDYDAGQGRGGTGY
jgi:hypothetical protein